MNPNSSQKNDATGETESPQLEEGQPDDKQGQEPTGTLTPAEITAQIEAVKKMDLAEETKNQVLQVLQEAEKSVKNAKEYPDNSWYDQSIEQETNAYQQQLEKVPAAAEEQLKPFAWTKDEGLDSLEPKLSALETRLNEIHIEKDQVEKDLASTNKTIETRKSSTDLQKEIDAVTERKKQIEGELGSEAPDGEISELMKARELLQRANQQELNKLNNEKLFYDARTKYLNAKKLALTAKRDNLTKLQKEFDKRIKELRDRVAELKLSEAERLVKAAPAPLKPLAEGVVELWKFRKSSEAPSTRAAQLKPKKDELEKLLKKLHQEETTTRERIRAASRPQTLAPILDHQRSLLSLLPSIYHYEQSEIDHRRQLNEYLGEQLKYKRQLEDLTNTDDELVELLKEYFEEQSKHEEQQDLINSDEELENLLDQYSAEQSKQQKFLNDAQELFNKKREALTTLITEYENLQRDLEELSTKEGEMVVFIEDYKEYLDQQSMWVPVAEVLQLQDFKKIEKGFAPLLEPANWQLLAQTLGREIWASPVWSGVIVMLVLAFFPAQTRLKRRLFQLSDEFSDSFLAPFALTRKAFFITLLLPLWLPVICWIVGYRLLRVLPVTDNPAANPAFVPAFGKALVVTAFTLCVLRLLRYLVKPNGLGEVHFRWPKQQIAKVRLHLHLFAVCVVPLVFLIVVIYNAGSSEERRSVGRILMVALLLLTSWFLYRVLAPANSKDQRTSSVKLSFWKKILIYGPCCVPLFFALLSISGYTYTAAVLMFRLIFSCGILLVLVMLNELAYRWVYIARGKLALEQARQRQEAREAEEAAKAEGGASDAPRGFDPASSGVDLSSINTQTRQLLTTSFGLAVFISMWWVWSDVTPQVAFLNRPVFEAGALVQMAEPAPAEGGDGSSLAAAETVSQTDGNGNSVTYGDLLIFILTIGITLIASKNLPGLLEISVLQNLPLDTGIRYAAGTIARYIVLAIGIVVALQFLGFGGAHVSFALGGLAVGLGFGLQEMFANFVSGIILLFEQPLRVGDIVTVGDVTGTVSRIRIRATTITDWDRKEFIIPNKEFITGQFNNWTLTDKINRVVILVGVAYGSDTERAKEILLRVCAEHPEVLEDPPPSAVFDLFGGSSLNITLRCYLPRLDNRLLTIHELHTAIDREFKKAGIEIAFPQMDLHLRSVDEIKNPIPLAQELPETEQV